MSEVPRTPPKTFGDKLKLIGPGIILAAAAIGSGELILTPRAGALFGLSIGWIILVSIVYKMFLTLGLARYTIATGEDIFVGFSHLPGPRYWFVWVMGVIYLLGAVGYSGISLACGSALYALFPSLTMVHWAVIVVILAYVLLLSGSYGPVEKAAFILSFVLIVGVLYSLAALRPDIAWFFNGLAPKLPSGSGQTAVSLLGWTAGGTSTLIYSFWILEKGIGKGKCEGENFKGWLSLIRLDTGISYFLMILISFAFLTIGVLVLRTAGPDGGPLIPAREETTSVLSRLLTVATGPQTKFIFLVAALAILYSTVIGLVDGKSRALRSATQIIFPKSKRISDKNMYRLFATLMCLIIFAFLFTKRPVVLIVLISAVEAPVLSVSAIMLIYLLHKKLPRALRPGFAWYGVIVCGTIVYLVLSSIMLIKTLLG
ncbi:MAG: Nramp family divalent metal transporter [Candidatus Aminicenantes bacterium]|nr:MAG: Nramp family divalent metal transporter [Candidatus Aminicenantes bacterium]